MTRILAFVSASCLFFISTAGAQTQGVRLQFSAVASDDAGDKVAKALEEVPSVKVLTKPMKANPVAELTFDLKQADVGELAKAANADAARTTSLLLPTLSISQAQRDKRVKEQGQTLVLNVLREETLKKLAPTLAKLTGVSPAGSSVSFTPLPKSFAAESKSMAGDAAARANSFVIVRLDPKGGAKYKEIVTALKEADFDILSFSEGRRRKK